MSEYSRYQGTRTWRGFEYDWASVVFLAIFLLVVVGTLVGFASSDQPNHPAERRPGVVSVDPDHGPIGNVEDGCHPAAYICD